MQELAELKSLGLTLPSPAYLFGLVLFSFIGIGVFAWGRKQQHKAVKWIGVALMFYPYLTPATWALYGVGTALCAALLFVRR